MERIDLSKPINSLDRDSVIPRPLSARKVRRVIKKAAKNKGGDNAASVKSATDSKVSEKEVEYKN